MDCALNKGIEMNPVILWEELDKKVFLFFPSIYSTVGNTLITSRDRKKCICLGINGFTYPYGKVKALGKAWIIS